MKLRRLSALLLTLAILLSLLSTGVVHGAGTRSARVFRSRTSYTYYTDEQLAEMLGVSLETLADMRITCHEAVMNNTRWDLSAYAIYLNDNAVQALLGLVCNNPEHFFISKISYSYYSDGRIAWVTPVYETDYATCMAKHEAFRQAADKILCLFRRDESLSDLELALLVHDYLAANYEYDVPFATGSDMYTAYGLLVNETAVCQGYAEAFAYLMTQLGINCGLCKSDTLNHAWNIVEIDGLEYHLDVTFDDPIYDRGGPVRHVNFLLSTDALKANDHDANDLTGTPGNTTYDTAFWQNVSSAFCYLDGTIYYINSSRSLCKWEDGVSTALYSIPGKWSPWPGNYNCLASDGERLFFSTPTAIYEYFPATNTIEVVYTPTLPSGHVIYGFQAKNNNFYIHPNNSPNFDPTTKADQEIVYNYRENEDGSHVYGEGTCIKEPTCREEGEAIYDCLYCEYSMNAPLPVGPHTEVTDTGVAPSCTATGLTEGKHCSVCGETITAREVIPATGHSEVTDIAVDPSCTATGLTEGKHCSVCGETLTAQEVIPATGHSEVTDIAVDPSCTATGLTEGKHCSVCGETITAQEVIPATGHSEVTDTGVAPSCTASGLTEGKHCSVCGETLTAQEVIPATGHSEVTDTAVDPSCTATGLTEGKHCSVCGETITAQEVIPANGHTEVIDSAAAPTCTTTGLTEGKHCSVCGETLTAQEEIPATGHSEVTDIAVDPSCTATGLTEGKHCSVCGETLTAQEVVPATGHAPVYTIKDETSHIITCANCDFTEEASHSYEEGLCMCGHAEVKEPVLESTWKLGHSLNLASDISVNYAIGRSTLAGYDLDSIYILAEIDSYKEGKYSVKEVKLLPVVNGSYYYFTLTGMTAVNMNDEIRAVLYGTKDGQVHYSPIDTYSVATYAYAQFGKATAAQKLKVLCAELLRYGAKAQIFKSYRLDALVDAKMTEEQKALLSDMEAVTFGNMNLTENIPATNAVQWLGKSLDLASKVSVKFIFSLGSYTGNTEDLTMKVTYKDVNGKDKEKIITDLEIYNASRGYYAFTLDSLLAAELRSVLTVQILSGDTVVSGTLQYAADTYGNGKADALGELCKALFAYSDSAKSYFAN